MARRIRDFLRVQMTARVARIIQHAVATRTFEDHAAKCKPDDLACPHAERGTLDMARAVESGIVIGEKRAHLDLACPFSLEDSDKQILVLERLGQRIGWIADGQKEATSDAIQRIVGEILAFARRNPMLVIAEAAKDPRSEPPED
jgi:hypothetical protein